MPSLPSCSDYSTSIVVGSLVKASQLAGGRPEMYNGKPIKYAGGYCIVFPYIASGKKYATNIGALTESLAKEVTAREAADTTEKTAREKAIKEITDALANPATFWEDYTA